MKKQLLVAASFVLLGLFTTSCNKEETPSINEDVTTSEDLTTLQNLMQDTEDELELQIELRDDESDCPTISVETTNGGFPKTYTIDFGAACEGPNGRIRSGQIVVTKTDTLSNPGAVRTATLVDFFVDGVQLQGTKTWTNQGLNADDQPFISREISGASITYPNGDVATWEASHIMTQIIGFNTPTILDNTFEVRGGSSGVNRNGVAFSSTITEPLIKNKTCRWIQKGTKEVMVGERTRTIDYGNGNCDRFAQVTFNNGVTVTVVLQRWW